MSAATAQFSKWFLQRSCFRLKEIPDAVSAIIMKLLATSGWR
jgi:hypothetical protein